LKNPIATLLSKLSKGNGNKHGKRFDDIGKGIGRIGSWKKTVLSSLLAGTAGSTGATDEGFAATSPVRRKPCAKSPHFSLFVGGWSLRSKLVSLDAKSWLIVLSCWSFSLTLWWSTSPQFVTRDSTGPLVWAFVVDPGKWPSADISSVQNLRGSNCRRETEGKPKGNRRETEGKWQLRARVSRLDPSNHRPGKTD
jgi:hypothetical protein